MKCFVLLLILGLTFRFNCQDLMIFGKLFPKENKVTYKDYCGSKKKNPDGTCKCEKTPEKFVKKSLLFILPHDFKKVESVQIKFLLKDLKFFLYYSNYKL